MPEGNVERTYSLFEAFNSHDLWWDDIFDLLPDLAIRPLEIRDMGDVTVAPTRYRGHGGTSRTPFDETNWLAYRWSEGKCVRWVSKSDEAEALEAVGVAQK